jgi:hypothetical protein
MEMNRNHYFMIGLILLLIGLQFRLVQSFQLTTESTRFINEKIKKKPAVSQSPLLSIFPSNNVPGAKTTIRPPKWLGWSLISIGAVLVLQSLGMKKPGG